MRVRGEVVFLGGSKVIKSELLETSTLYQSPVFLEHIFCGIYQQNSDKRVGVNGDGGWRDGNAEMR